MGRLEPHAVVRHLDRLYRAAWALCGSREDAEDLVQETVVRVLARPRRLRGEEELGYLLSALRNTFLTSRRTASRRPQQAATLDDVAVGDPRPSGRPEAALEANELFVAISRLPDDFRLALIAVDVVGLSYREAANALGTREATITSRLHRARERVADDVSGRSGRSPEGTNSSRSLLS
jgi:RNA polymerase sigma-70 factor (ECF subfamily)